MSDETKKFWMVLRDGADATRHRHVSLLSATKEAERLASQVRGARFFVLEVAAVVSQVSEQYARRTLVGAPRPRLARALCRVEWNVWGDCDLLCPCCYAPRLRGHAPTCYLDAALTAAGLSEKDREEVRRGQEA